MEKIWSYVGRTRQTERQNSTTLQHTNSNTKSQIKNGNMGSDEFSAKRQNRRTYLNRAATLPPRSSTKGGSEQESTKGKEETPLAIPVDVTNDVKQIPESERGSNQPEVPHQGSESDDQKTALSTGDIVLSKYQYDHFMMQIDHLTKSQGEEVAMLQQRLHERGLEVQSLLAKLEQERMYCEKVEEDNSMLRSSIVAMKDPGPINTDAYYSERLKRLNQSTKSWAASAVKSRQNENARELSDSDVNSVIQALEKYPQGRSVSETIKGSGNSIRAIAQNPRCQIALVRQLIWMHLYELVFKPFCFGLPTNFSDMMHNTIRSICDKEKKFTNVLMIRQATGRGILEQVKGRHVEMKKMVTEDLEKLLKIFFPIRQDLGRKIEKFVDSAVELANTMAEEKALFFCTMIDAGSVIENTSMQVSDDSQNKRVYMCTFPLFAIRVMEDGRETLVYLTKADVETENLFCHT